MISDMIICNSFQKQSKALPWFIEGWFSFIVSLMKFQY